MTVESESSAVTVAPATCVWFAVYPVIFGEVTVGYDAVVVLVHGVYVISPVTSSFVAVRVKVT